MPAGAGLPAFVRERQHALLSRNWAQLEALLDPDLRYVHATGVRHDKSAYLAFVRERIRVEALDLDVVALWPGEASVVLTGRLRQRLVRAGETAAVEAESWVTEVWRQADGWRLLAFQSTRVAP